MVCNVKNLNGMSLLKNLKNLVAVVTGGASGLGRATAERLVNQGAKVVICDISNSDGDDVAKQLGDNCVFSSTDVTSCESVKKMIRMTEEKFQKLDVVINCAGVACAFQIYNFLTDHAHDLEDYDNLLNVNAVGTFNVLSQAAGLLGKNTPDENGQRGVIINTSSVSAFEGQIGQSAYAASTSAVVAMTLPIARDLSKQGIRCCTIAPGLFQTPMCSYPPKIESFLSETMCFPNRFGRPEEYAHLVQYIIENPMLNGETIRLDGGIHLFS